MTVAIAFMFKPGHQLEREAILLASSIRQFVRENVSLYAFIEVTDVGNIEQWHKDAFETLQVTIRVLPAGEFFSTTYPHGNKILVCAQKYTESRVIFLDSDMIFVRETDLSPITQGSLVLSPTLGGQWGGHDEWVTVYDLFGVSEADIPRIKLDEDREIEAYYNAGMISFRQETGFGESWLSVAQKIDKSDSILNKRPWLDQISLPVVQFDGGPEVSTPTEAGFNVRPRRGMMGNVVLTHYTQNYLFLSGVNRIANQVLHQQLGSSLRQLEKQSIITEINIFKTKFRNNQSKPFVKIYGERNTGTNFLQRVITDNFHTKVLHSTNDSPEATKTIFHALGISRSSTNPPPQDLSDSVILRNGLGWKHGAPPFSIIASSPYRGETLFLCVYKNPYFWLKSFHKISYNPSSMYTADLDFSEFLSRPFGLSARDRLSAPFDTTPLEMYQMKMRNYLKLKSVYGKDVLLISYEKLLINEGPFLKELSQHLHARNDFPGFPLDSAKKIDVGKYNFEDYALKYQDENRTEGLLESEIAFVESRLDRALWREIEWQSIFNNPSCYARLRRFARSFIPATGR